MGLGLCAKWENTDLPVLPDFVENGLYAGHTSSVGAILGGDARLHRRGHIPLGTIQICYQGSGYGPRGELQWSLLHDNRDRKEWGAR